jgi:uncharacterized protein YecT (DUF1311 family)
MILVGVLTAIVGVGGFVDTRKVDRRYKTGYRNNEPDTRNFGRAARRVLYGIGICIVGAAVDNLTDSKTDSSPPVQVQSSSAPNQTVANESDASTNVVVKLDPNAAQNDSGAREPVASNERIESTGAQSSGYVPQTGSSGADGISTDAATTEAQPHTYATSFDCRRASQDDEKTICGDAGLAAMDRQLSQLYDASLKTIDDPQALKQSESDWLIRRHMCDKDLDCLRRAYDERIGQFLGSLGSKPLISTNSSSAGA